MDMRCGRHAETRDGGALVRWAVGLAGRSLRAMHEECWGWDERAMLRELKVRAGTPPRARTHAGRAADSPPQSDAALLLVVRRGGGEPVAFCHFRFDVELGDAVLYLYEMHVEAAWRGAGLGRRMMAALRRIAREAGMDRVLLTVRAPSLARLSPSLPRSLTHSLASAAQAFVANAGARAFYARIGFGVDRTCPSKHGRPECKYRIMSIEP